MRGEHGFQIIQAQVIRMIRMISIRQPLPAREDVIVKRDSSQARERVEDSEEEIGDDKQDQGFN